MSGNNRMRVAVSAALAASVLGSGLALAPSAEASTVAGTAISFAKAQIGDPYSQVNPQGPNHWDCSGLVRASFKKAGKSLHRVAKDQYNSSKVRTINAKDRKPGDLVFFGGSSSIYHVGIYYGWKYKGKAGGWILHSPRPGKTVRVEKLWTKSVKYKRVK